MMRWLNKWREVQGQEKKNNNVQRAEQYRHLGEPAAVTEMQLTAPSCSLALKM